jgi:hypothetical protein
MWRPAMDQPKDLRAAAVIPVSRGAPRARRQPWAQWALPRYPGQTVPGRLWQFRRERGWRQVDLAMALGVDEMTVINPEKGRPNPRGPPRPHGLRSASLPSATWMLSRVNLMRSSDLGMR